METILLHGIKQGFVLDPSNFFAMNEVVMSRLWGVVRVSDGNRDGTNSAGSVKASATYSVPQAIYVGSVVHI